MMNPFFLYIFVNRNSFYADSSTSTSSSGNGNSSTRPIGTTSSISPEVLPPKQAKQSNSPAASTFNHPPTHRMEDDDLDELLNLNVPARSNPSQSQLPTSFVGRGASGPAGSNGPMQNFEAALRNIPTVSKKKFNQQCITFLENIFYKLFWKFWNFLGVGWNSASWPHKAVGNGWAAPIQSCLFCTIFQEILDVILKSKSNK